jgi:hypothetical protein
MEWLGRRSGVPRGDAYTLSAKNARRREHGLGRGRGWPGGSVSTAGGGSSAATASKQALGAVSEVNVVTCAEPGVSGAGVLWEPRARA